MARQKKKEEETYKATPSINENGDLDIYIEANGPTEIHVPPGRRHDFRMQLKHAGEVVIFIPADAKRIEEPKEKQINVCLPKKEKKKGK